MFPYPLLPPRASLIASTSQKSHFFLLKPSAEYYHTRDLSCPRVMPTPDTPALTARLTADLADCIDTLPFPAGATVHRGKVRESLLLSPTHRAIVVTDRISAFDLVLGTVPHKGRVLSQLAAWWFEQIGDTVPTHFIAQPDPNVTLTRTATPLPVEIVIRGYLTGSTSTSSWHAYQHHDQVICGYRMPDNMVKNQPFAEPIITPTTKPTDGTHDAPISPEQIVAQGLVTADVYARAEEIARTLFALGQRVAADRGLILVDTKYEMGLTPDGELIVIDEVHTPDSSRYWLADTYHDRMAQGQEPDMFDKEFVRRQLVAKGIDITADTSTYDGTKFMTDDLRVSAALRYLQLFQQMTGQPLTLPSAGTAPTPRIMAVLSDLMAQYGG